jgi:hypothetical protein
MLYVTPYHSFLRIASAVCALVLVFESGLVVKSTKILADNTQQYLANAIGATASVTPTELNQLTAALTEQRTELEAREAALREREIQVNLATNDQPASSDTSTYVLSSILFILLVLILLNYILDYLRLQERQREVGV